ncbi:MAG: type I methionyl aminopeptidase [Acidimicrobiales bacterium]|nr:type I methionyl aminopeptidase [Acidimicrobiales bacterium]
MLFAKGAAVRSGADIAKMRKAGLVVAEMHERIREAIRPGVTTGKLDRVGRDVLARRGATSNFLGYASPPFPAVICASPNAMVVHGIPSDDVRLDEGDIISIDCGAVVDGWHGDAAFTAPVGEVDADLLHLIEVAERSLEAAIETMIPGNRLGDIGNAVETVAREGGLSVVEGFTGHGIGRAMHEAPNVPNQGVAGTGLKLRAGNVLAVEPMLVLGDAEVELLDDDWSVVTVSQDPAAHVEHTIAITEDGPWVLTRA